MRKFVVKCLKESIHLERQVRQSTFEDEDLALELAFCYKIGFGTNRDEGASSALLQQTGIRTENLEKKLLALQQTSDRLPVFTDSMYGKSIKNGQDFRVDLPEGYRAEQRLECAIS